ncbi:MAG: 3-hydroxyisobutyrate dehydrogenase, partial [Alteromonadaceae bacterium]
MATVAFIGLGNMGGPMAINLVKAGHTVTVFDLSPAAIADVVAVGGKQADTTIAAVKRADFVISMLPAGKHVESVYLGDEGLINHLDESTLVIDSSTIDSGTAQKVAAALGEKGIHFVDAPVSGGVGGAKAGTLTFIVGGEADDFAKAKTVLDDMGKNIFHAGGHGAGQVAKVCNNML